MYDVLIIGSGYGGLAAALSLCEQGKKVLLCEALKYPGGCASTFQKDGYSFEAGATLFSGFANEQLFRRWIQQHDLNVAFDVLDPPISFRTAQVNVALSSDREVLIDNFCALPNAPKEKLRAFFALQKSVADALWPIFDQPSRLPPMGFHDVLWHLGRVWRYPFLLPLLNRSLEDLLQSYGVSDFEPFVHYCNALCQITIQTSVDKAEAAFALSAMDYLFRGTGHIHGGIGQLGSELLAAIERLGGEVRLSTRVKALRFEGGCWQAQVRGETVQARHIIANLLPQAASSLVDKPLPARYQKIQDRVNQGWGAAMLYLVIDDHPGLPRTAHHFQAVDEASRPFLEGNHIFCSLSAPNEFGETNNKQRTATVSTHVSMPLLRQQNQQEQAAYIEKVQSQMRQTLNRRVPEVAAHIAAVYPASPRTFERFTRRPFGYVGGVPRTKGWHNYAGIWPQPIFPNCWLVGDSVFPGQSTLSTAVGGVRTARAVASYS